MTTKEQATKKSRKKPKGFGTNKGEPSVSRRNPNLKMSEAYRVPQDVREAARKCLMLHGKGVVYDSDDGITIAPYPTGDRFVDNMVRKSKGVKVLIVRKWRTNTIFIPWKPKRIVNGYYQPKAGLLLD